MKKTAIQKNYQMHESHFSSKKKDVKKLFSTWTKKDTTDYWRHKRMYQLTDPLILSDKKSSWLTIGDGRFGKDANYILSKGIKNIIATDIDDSLLKIGKKRNFIPSFKKANAEKLPFKNNEFDYVFCKESFHHFPRPFIALYEMIRVVSKAVILIEPHDISIKSSPVARLKSLLKPSKFSHINKYEDSGNFVYGIGKRELEKVALGIDLPAVAYKGIDDHHIKGVEEEVYSNSSPLAIKIKRKIKIASWVKKVKLRESSMMGYIFFKKHPSKKTLKLLKKSDYIYKKLPRNPYL